MSQLIQRGACPKEDQAATKQSNQLETARLPVRHSPNGISLTSSKLPLIAGSLDLTTIKNANHQLNHQEPFRRTRKAYRRIIAELTDAEGHPRDQVAADKLASIHKKFTEYTQAWLLHCMKVPTEQIEQKIGARIRGWLEDGSMPLIIRRADPKYQEPAKIQVSLPQGKSTALAYVLGAFAGAVRSNRNKGKVTFRTTELSDLDELKSALQQSFGIPIKIGQQTVGLHTYVVIRINSSDAVDFLHDATKGNTHLSWCRLLTKDERLAFLQGFFRFTRGNISVQDGHFRTYKKQGANLLREIMILLKREGLYSMTTGFTNTTLQICDPVELTKLLKLDVLTDKKQKDKLHVICKQQRESLAHTPDDYFAVMSHFKTIPGFPNIPEPKIRAALTHKLPQCTIPAATVANWLRDDNIVPHSVKRFRAIQQTEQELHTPSFLSEIAGAIIKRAKRKGLNTSEIVKGIAEWWGGNQKLAELSKVPIGRIKNYQLEGVLPPIKDFQAILATVGIDDPEQYAIPLPTYAKPQHEITGFVPMTVIESWVTGRVHQVTIMRYQASIALTVQAALSEGKDIKAAVHNQLRTIRQRIRKVNAWKHK